VGKGSQRRGVVLWLVLTLTVVLGMMFFSFHLSVRQRNAQAHAAYFGAVAHSLAQSGINLAFHELRGAGETEGSPLWTQLVEAEAGGLTGTQPSLDLAPYLEKLTEGLGEDLDLEVEAEVLAAEPLVPEGEPVATHDPVEKRILLEVRARGEFRGMVRNLAEQRELRVQLDALPVLNRFTLFLRAPETGGAGDLG